MYRILHRDGMAKRGELTTVHGTIQTPVFMNVGTAAAIKGAVSSVDLTTIGTQVELCNTYHLHVRPGDTVVRGGQFVHIPVRQPLGILVADGYAAIGDSAFMTVPIIGSGIANSLKASHLLCEAIEADKDGAYSAYTLWKYQCDFFKELGAGLAPLACVKLLLTRLEPSDLDYIFETGILNADDMTIDADSTSLGAILGGMKMEDLKIKAGGLVKNPTVLKKILRMGKELGVATAVTAAMPKVYDPEKALRWVKNYNACFKH